MILKKFTPSKLQQRHDLGFDVVPLIISSHKTTSLCGWFHFIQRSKSNGTHRILSPPHATHSLDRRTFRSPPPSPLCNTIITTVCGRYFHALPYLHDKDDNGVILRYVFVNRDGVDVISVGICGLFVGWKKS